MIDKRKSLRKFIAIVSGFLIMMGILLLGFAALGAIGFLNAGSLLENKHMIFFAVALISVGLLDMLSSVVIARW